MRKIGVIGHFGGKEVFLDGQTVKTKNFCRMAEEHGYTVFRVDTYLRAAHPFRLLLRTLRCMCFCRQIVILLSVNGMNFYLPFLYLVNSIFHCKIYHDIIGSELLAMVDENPRLVRYLNALTVNWFEYESGAAHLREKGVHNVEVLPNCKVLTPVSVASCSAPRAAGGAMRFCTFSRVMEEKGITDAAESVAALAARGVPCELDIYGAVDVAYRGTLELLLEKHAGTVRYCGTVDSEKSVQTLCDYDALLFPTRWSGEGFPGTVLDAFAAGLPVLASDHNADRELIEDGVCGLIYPGKHAKTLADAVLWAAENREALHAMRLACRKTYDLYTPEAVWAKISAKLEEDRKDGTK